MARWHHAEYRDFDGRPRLMVCSGAPGTFLFLCRHDPARGEYAAYYEVYRLPPIADSEVCASWFGLETRAFARLADLPVEEFPFDIEQRRFLDYDPIAPRLAGRR